MPSVLQCMDCHHTLPLDARAYTCPECGGLLDVNHDFSGQNISRELFDSRLGAVSKPYNSGVWRFKELVYPDIVNSQIVTKPEGNTNLYDVPRLGRWVGVETLYLKHEGENPTGSFKDRGMTGGVTHAVALGVQRVACASTGNTSAALAAYAALAEIQGIVFFENKNIALGKLSQAIAYGATCVQIDADFDRNLQLVREVAQEIDIYVLNSINPFRLEGQKTIVFETLQQLEWQVPDWIVVPGGNLGNSSAFGKGLYEMHQLGLIDRLPRLAIIQAEHASPLYESFQRGFDMLRPVQAKTVASAIKIGNPVNYPKAVRALSWTNGVVERVTDQEIMDAKARVDAVGIGCEPASACSVAGARKLRQSGVIQHGESVVAVLTGHLLKDPDATVNYHRQSLDDIHASFPNALLQAAGSKESVIDALNRTAVQMQPFTS